MNSRPTPGPWSFDPNESPAIIRNPSGLHIAEVLPQGPEREANGYMLAAAPDLLEACTEMCSWSAGPTYEKACAAIAKAKGGK